MKVSPVNSTKMTNFQGKTKFLSAPFSYEGNLTNGEAYGLACGLTVVPGVEFAKKGFKNVSTLGKVGKIASGAGIMLGLAVPIFASIKLLDTLCTPSYVKNNLSSNSKTKSS